MLELLTLKPKAFGLDISDLSLKIIKLKKRGKFFDLASFEEKKIKPGIIKVGEIKDEKALIQILKKALAEIKGEKLRTKYVVASLPEEKAFLQVIQMPKMKKEELKSAVVYEAENYIPLPIEEVYLDSQIVPPVHNHLPGHQRKVGSKKILSSPPSLSPHKSSVMNEAHQLDHLDVLIAALPKKTVDPYLFSLREAGLKPIAFEVESQAIARALIKNEVTTFPLLLIDLGATRTGFIVFSGHSLRLTSSIPVSSQNFNEIISKALGVNLVEAERLKIKYGLQSKIKKGKEVFEALIPALTDLTDQIKRYLHYYQTHASHEHLPPNGKGVEKIFLCGGGAKLKGLTNFLSSQLKIPVEISNPWVNILAAPIQPKEQRLIYKKEESLSYTTALGLALRGIKYR
jgi:type IV pilus assembly protein PilM